MPCYEPSNSLGLAGDGATFRGADAKWMLSSIITLRAGFWIFVVALDFLGFLIFIMGGFPF